MLFSITDLRSCVIGNDSVIGLKVTKLSLEFGFVDCEYLSNLELYGTKVRNEEELEIQGIAGCYNLVLVRNFVGLLKVRVGDLEDKLQNHPSIVTARVSKDRDSTYYGLLSN